MGIFKKIFGRKKQELLEPIDISVLEVDMHSHLIPGIDDGAQTMEQTLELLQEFSNLGYRKVITTPHTMSDYYKNNPQIILAGLADVKKALKEKEIKIELEAASEYNLDADFEGLIDRKELLTFGANYLLFELPFFQEPPMLDSIIWKLQTSDYKPVLAHVERYPFWFKDWERILDVKARGVLFQLNINSLTGHYGAEVRLVAEKLIDHNLVDFVATDCHNINHIGVTKQALKYPYLHKVIKEGKLLNNQL